MGLGNPFEAIVHHLIIRGMTSLDYWDEVFMVKALVCMVTHWTRLTMSHDIRLLGSHDFVGNLGLLRSHALDLVGCMQIYPKLSKFFTTKNLVFKNNIDTIKNIYLENNATYL